MKIFCIITIQLVLLFSSNNWLLSQQNISNQTVQPNSALNTVEQFVQEARKWEEYGNYQKAGEWWESAAQKVINMNNKIDYMNKAAMNYKLAQNYDRSLYFFSQASNLANNINDSWWLASIYYEFAKARFEKSKNQDTLNAISLLNKAIHHSKINAQNYPQGSLDQIWSNDFQTEILIERAVMRARHKNFRDALLDFDSATKKAESNWAWANLEQQIKNGKIDDDDYTYIFKKFSWCLYLEGYCFYDKYMTENKQSVADGIYAVQRFKEKFSQDTKTKTNDLIKKNPKIFWCLGMLYENLPGHDKNMSHQYKLASAELGYADALLWRKNSNFSIPPSLIKPIITMKADKIDYVQFKFQEGKKVAYAEQFEISGSIFYDQSSTDQAQAIFRFKNPQSGWQFDKNIKLRRQWRGENSPVLFSFVDTIHIPEKMGLWEITAVANYQNQPNVKDSQTVKRTPFFDQDPKNRFTGKNTAIFFANNYEGTKSTLNNPIYDAEALASTLDQRYNFNSTIFREASGRKIREELNKLINVEKTAKDQLVIVLSGHGAPDGFFVAINERKESEPIYYDDLKSLLLKTGFKRILLVIDACFSGTAVENKAFAYNSSFATRGNTTRSIDFLLNSQTSMYGSNQNKITNEAIKSSEECYQILTSGDNQPVDDGIMRFHSPFVKRLLEILENAETNVFPSEIDSKINDISGRVRLGKFYKESSGGEFCFEPIRYK